MNIFYLHKCPKKAAEYMYSKHVVKMILETAQLLCSAHHILDDNFYKVPYKLTHKNHPSSIWVRSSDENYFWAYRHMIHLGEEYSKRYGKDHLTITKCKDVLYNLPKNIENKPFFDPPQCMPEKYHSSNCVDSYWDYYISEKHTVANKDEIKYIKKPKF